MMMMMMVMVIVIAAAVSNEIITITIQFLSLQLLDGMFFSDANDSQYDATYYGGWLIRKWARDMTQMLH